MLDTAGWPSSAPHPVPLSPTLTWHMGAGCPQGGEDGSVLHTHAPMGTAVLGTWHMAQAHDIHIPQPRQSQVPLLPPPCRCLLRKELINQGPK